MAPPAKSDYAVLRHAVSEVLHHLWDPIDVAGDPQARDEYEDYVDRVLQLLLRGGTGVEIAAMLVNIAEQAMGISATEDRAARASRALLHWHHALALE